MIFNPNICSCRAVYTSSPCPSSNTQNCIRLCDFIISSNDDNAPWPCGDSAQVVFDNRLTIPSNCEASYSIVSHTSNLTNVQINSTGIGFESNWSEGDNFLVGEIVYEISCGILTDRARVHVFFKKGEVLDCDEGYKYNPCNGECEEVSPELSLTGDDTPQIGIS